MPGLSVFELVREFRYYLKLAIEFHIEDLNHSNEASLQSEFDMRSIRWQHDEK